MSKHGLFAALAASLLISACRPAAVRVSDPARHGMDPASLARIDTSIANCIAEGNIPGAVVAVVREDALVFLKAYGHKSFVPDTLPMTVETIFDIASLSKCVGTTTAVMQLIEDGRLQLDDPVKRYIPEFEPWTDPDSGEMVDIRVRDLMTHASGLDAYYSADRFVQRFGTNQPDSLLRVIATEAGRNFRPGTGFLYSCLNFITLQNIVQRITGQRLCDYVQQHVFDALGLKHSCYFALESDMRTPSCHQELLPLVAPTSLQADGTPLLGAVHDPLARLANGGNSGNAGIFSNAIDLSRFCIALLNGGVAPANKGMGFPEASQQILRPETIELMCTIPQENDPSVGRALGWDKKSAHSSPSGDIFDKETTLCHTGYTGTTLVIDFKTRTAIVMLTNRVHPSDDGLVGPRRRTIANIVAGSITE